MGCLRQMAGKTKRQKQKKLGGIQRRWLVNIVSWVVLLVVVCVFAGALAIASYYYSNMRYSM